MSTVDTSTWSPDADQNANIEGTPLNSDAGIAQTWKVIAILMAALKGDGTWEVPTDTTYSAISDSYIDGLFA